MSARSASPTIVQSPAEKFFGLSRRPFSLTPDLRFAYHSRSHTHALEEVTAALRRREGLIVVTGAIGTGKTMLCRTLLETFEARTFLSLILDPGLEVEDLLRQVLTDFGILTKGEDKASRPAEITRHQFVTAMQQFLASLIPLKAHAVIMIDEAQHLSPRVLEEIRLLSNFETDEAKLLQIVLVGQPDLEDLLRRPEMQQLNQRVTRRCQLHPLSPPEVADYIDRRLTVAADDEKLPQRGERVGTGGDRVVRFTQAASRSVAAISAGIPRVVNTLCDRVLDVAYERQMLVIEPDVVVEAAERLQLGVPGGVPLPLAAGRRLPTTAAAAIVAAVLLGAGWWWMRDPVESSRPPAQSDNPAPVAPAAAPAASQPASQSTFQPASAAPGASAPAAGIGAAGQAAASPATPAASAPAASDSTEPFVIAVAAFRTEQRAQDVSEAVSALDVPAVVRLDPTGAWYRVIAGPFATSDAATVAQETLTRNGYTDTRISRITSVR